MKKRILPLFRITIFSKNAAFSIFLIGLIMLFYSTHAGGRNHAIDLPGKIENYKLKKHFIGEIFGGGIVFYIDEKGEHGLVVSKIDLKTNSKWGYLDSAVNANAKEMGAGKLNTSKICSLIKDAEIAARLCTEYAVDKFKDWYLPSIDELNVLYTNLKQQKLGDLSNAMYWSSSETDFNNAWAQNFETGFVIERHVNTPCHVRAIRAF